MAKENIDKLEFIKIKNCCTVNSSISEIRNLTDGRKYFQIIYLIMELYPKYFENSYNSTIKRSIVQLKTGQSI